MELEKWANNGDFKRLLATFETRIPLRKPTGLAADDDLRNEIFYLSEGLLGIVAEMLSRSAELAVKSGEERITLEHVRAVAPENPWRPKKR
jgi:hypothetical protein